MFAGTDPPAHPSLLSPPRSRLLPSVTQTHLGDGGWADLISGTVCVLPAESWLAFLGSSLSLGLAGVTVSPTELQTLNSWAYKPNQFLLFIFPREDLGLLKEKSHGKRKKRD